MNLSENKLVCGSVFRIKNLEFLDKPKYCLLMETYNGSNDPILVLLITSKVEKYKHLEWTTIIKKGTFQNLPEESLIDCNNCWKVPVEQLLNRSTLLGCLSTDLMKNVYRALQKARKPDLDDVVRMMNFEPYK